MFGKVEVMKPTYEELEQERNKLAAQVERLRECTTPAIKLMRATGELSGWHEKADLIESVISETKPTILASLKAQWQAEAVESILNLDYGYIQYEDGSFAYTEEAISNHAESIRQHLQEDF